MKGLYHFPPKYGLYVYIYIVLNVIIYILKNSKLFLSTLLPHPRIARRARAYQETGTSREGGATQGSASQPHAHNPHDRQQAAGYR